MNVFSAVVTKMTLIVMKSLAGVLNRRENHDMLCIRQGDEDCSGFLLITLKSLQNVAVYSSNHFFICIIRWSEFLQVALGTVCFCSAASEASAEVVQVTERF